MSNGVRVVLVGVLVAAAVVLFIVLRPGDDDESSPAATTAPTTMPTTTAPTTTAPPATTPPPPPPPAPAVRVFRVAVPAGGPERIVRWRAKQDDRVRIVVTLAEADEVHLHGYDIERSTGPGQPPARIELRATIPGRFELELHHTGQLIAELRVDP